MVLFATVLFQAIDTVPMATDSSRACSLEGYLCLLSQRKKRGSRVDERGRFCGGKKGEEMGNDGELWRSQSWSKVKKEKWGQCNINACVKMKYGIINSFYKRWTL